jgi:hypothetical protein
MGRFTQMEKQNIPLYGNSVSIRGLPHCNSAAVKKQHTYTVDVSLTSSSETSDPNSSTKLSVGSFLDADCGTYILYRSIAEPHHFYAAPPENFDAAPAAPAPAPTLLHRKPKFF